MALTLGIPACTFEVPPADGTSYRCGAGSTCPTGQSCVEGICRGEIAGSGSVDGGSSDGEGPEIDARRATDAAPGSPDAGPSGPTTLTFGERSTADVRGVTFDTFLQSDAPATANGSAGTVLVDGSPSTVGLIRFDLRAVPVGSTVQSAELVLFVNDPYRPYNGEIASADLLTRAWDEDEATWSQSAAGVAWSTAGAGGDAIGATAISSFAPQVDQSFTVALPVAVVQGWVAQPTANFGLRWRGTGNNNLQFQSSEGTDADRPLLRVTFSP